MARGGKINIVIKKGDLETFYLKEKLPISKIAKKYKCSKNTICYWLIKYNIKQRTASESMKLFGNRKPINISKEKLNYLYKIKKLPISKIAEEFKCKNSTIIDRLRKYNITNEFSNNKMISIDKKTLKKLYVNKKLGTYEIADIFGCCQATIWKKLKEFNIDRRTPQELNSNVPSKSLLKKLYINNKLSTWEIEKRYRYSRSTIYRKLKEYKIKIRNRAQSHITYKTANFNGNLIDKSYLIGFRLGDLRVRKIWKNSEVIHVDCGSTIKEQIDLIYNLFKDYGHIWISEPNKKNKVQIECHLNPTFDFLLNKSIPYKLLNNNKTFFAFLAGFTDAEGNIGINHNQAVYQLGNYNKEILIFIKNGLKRYDIGVNGIYESKNKGKYNNQGYIYNDNYKQISTVKKDNLLKLLNNLKPYIKHERKVRDLNLAIANINERNKKLGV